MVYNVVVTPDAENDLDVIIYYLVSEKQNEQAAVAVLSDFEETKNVLSRVAGSLKFCDDDRLKEKGYRRINFQTHRYFMIYHTEDDMAIIDNIFHELQDYENILA